MSSPTRTILLLAALLAIQNVVGNEYELPFFLSLGSKQLKQRVDCVSPMTDAQREWCRWNDDIVGLIVDGATKGLDECEYRFQKRRWNCTSSERDHFRAALSRGTRESAFTYAVTSAAIAWSVSRQCALREDLTQCGCGREDDEAGDDWDWGGCGDNLDQGRESSARFLRDDVKSPSPERRLMDDHNIKAGIEIAVRETKRNCRCHGLCGACAIKSCWKELPRNFHQIGAVVENKFDGSVKMKLNSGGGELEVAERNHVPPSNFDLVYLESTDYSRFCVKDSSVGSHGTHGRLCDPESSGTEGCAHLCCGRGYDTFEETDIEKCNCKFVWCCRIECEKCYRKVKRSYCKE